MATKTPNIRLSITPAVDTTKNFDDWWIEMSSDDASSNMMIIDSEIKGLKDNKSDITHTHNISQVGGSKDNFLHNWDFRNVVNNKGQSSYSGTNIEIIDRWNLVETYSTVTVTASYVTLNGAMWQYLSRASSQVYGKQFTLSVMIGDVVYSSTLTWGLSGETKTGNFTGTSDITWKIVDKRIGLLTSSNVNIQAVKLESGTVSTLLNEPTADRILQDLICTSLAGGTAPTSVNGTPYATTSGTANTYTASLNPPLVSYVDGMSIAVKINVTNTGACTLNIDGAGAKAIKDSKGLDLRANTLNATCIYTLRYNGSNFILQGSGGGAKTRYMSRVATGILGLSVYEK